MTDDEIVAGYVRTMRLRNLARNTVNRRMKTFRMFRAHLGGRSLGAATIDDIEDFLATKEAPETRKAYAIDLTMLYRWAVLREVVADDPTLRLERARIPKRQPTPLRDEQVAALLAALPADSDVEAAVCLALYAGLRVGDIAALHTDDVDCERAMLVIRSGKGGKPATLPMAPPLVEVMRRRAPGPVVRSTSGNQVGKMLREFMRGIGLHVRPHDLRHTFGTNIAKATNGNLIAVAKLMRHSSYATSQAYIDWQPDGGDAVSQLYVDLTENEHPTLAGQAGSR